MLTFCKELLASRVRALEDNRSRVERNASFVEDVLDFMGTVC